MRRTKHDPIITSFLDQDFYKFTMGQAIAHNWPDTWVKYRFKNRSPVSLLPYKDEIQEEINALANLTLTPNEHGYLEDIPFLKRGFTSRLRSLRFDPEMITLGEKDGDIDVTVEADWSEGVWAEIFFLAICNEVYFRNLFSTSGEMAAALNEGDRRLTEKIELLKKANPAEKAKRLGRADFRIMEFGTRRRFSRAWQQHVLTRLIEEVPEYIQGTSNADLARRLAIPVQGTMAHEWLQAHQALTPLQEFQRHALNIWLNEYRGSLGIALTDIIGFNAFLRDFDPLLARSFDGGRHDSGDPFVWGDKLLGHYDKLGIDSKTKIAVWSDGLDFELSLRLWEHFSPAIKTIFGIGTNLSNDTGNKALQVVMKLVEVNHMPVAKISDSSGKGMCESPTFVPFLKELFKIE